MTITINGSGTVTGLAVGGLNDGVVQLADLGATTGKNGPILQVLQAVKTDISSTTSSTWADLPGLSVAITPASSSNKILFLYDLKLGSSGASMGIRLRRGSTDINQADAVSGYGQTTSQTYGGTDTGTGTYGMNSQTGMFLDSPGTTSATTYTVHWSNLSNSATFYCNRSSYYTGVYAHGGASSMTLLEVAA